MLCDKCHEHESIVRITLVIEEKSISIRLCKTCLKKLSVSSSIFENISSIYVELMISLLSKYLTDKYNFTNFNSDNDINSWESEQDEFLGFDLYENQYENLEFNHRNLQENIQSNTEFTIVNLQKRLSNAVKEENYEYAAILRDRIIELRNVTNNK